MALRVKSIGRRQRDGERGAMLIQAAITFIALLALTTFVVDFGVMWASRRQAQNAADAGALAGVTAMAYDSYTDRTAAGPAKQSAYLIATQHTVWGQVPSVNIDTDVTFPTCPDGSDGCIRVDVYRNENHGNPLPILFGALVGLTGQGVQATATGEVLVGNASNCIKPWVIPDKFTDLNGNSIFDKYLKSGSNVITIDPAQWDTYIAPSKTSSGTGYSPLPASEGGDYGKLLTLKVRAPGDTVSPGFYFPVDLPLPPAGAAIPGGAQYRENIFTCSGWPVKIGDRLTPEPGGMVGPTQQGVRDLIAKDQGAYWDASTGSIKNSCAPSACGDISPRIIAIALVNPDKLAQSIAGNSYGRNTVLEVTNILGFFINEQTGGGDVTGYIFSYPGMTIGSPPIGIDQAFLKYPTLIR